MVAYLRRREAISLHYLGMRNILSNRNRSMEVASFQTDRSLELSCRKLDAALLVSSKNSGTAAARFRRPAWLPIFFRLQITTSTARPLDRVGSGRCLVLSCRCREPFQSSGREGWHHSVDSSFRASAFPISQSRTYRQLSPLS